MRSYFDSILKLFLCLLLVVSGGLSASSRSPKPDSYDGEIQKLEEQEAYKKEQAERVRALSRRVFEKFKSLFSHKDLRLVEHGHGIETATAEVTTHDVHEFKKAFEEEINKVDKKHIIDTARMAESSSSKSLANKIMRFTTKLQPKNDYDKKRYTLTLMRFAAVGTATGISMSFMGNPEISSFITGVVAGTLSGWLQYANHTFLDLYSHPTRFISKKPLKLQQLQKQEVIDHHVIDSIAFNLSKVVRSLSKIKLDSSNVDFLQKKLEALSKALARLNVTEKKEKKLKKEIERFHENQGKSQDIINLSQYVKKLKREESDIIGERRELLSDIEVYRYHKKKIKNIEKKILSLSKKLSSVDFNGLDSDGFRDHMEELIKDVKAIKPQRVATERLEVGLRRFNLRMALLGIKDFYKTYKEKVRERIYVDKAYKISPFGYYYKWWSVEVAFLYFVPSVTYLIQSLTMGGGVFDVTLGSILAIAVMGTLLQGALESVNVEQRRIASNKLIQDKALGDAENYRKHIVNQIFNNMAEWLSVEQGMSKKGIESLRRDYIKDTQTPLLEKISSDPRLKDIEDKNYGWGSESLQLTKSQFISNMAKAMVEKDVFQAQLQETLSYLKKHIKSEDGKVIMSEPELIESSSFFQDRMTSLYDEYKKHLKGSKRAPRPLSDFTPVLSNYINESFQIEIDRANVSKKNFSQHFESLEVFELITKRGLYLFVLEDIKNKVTHNNLQALTNKDVLTTKQKTLQNGLDRILKKLEQKPSPSSKGPRLGYRKQHHHNKNIVNIRSVIYSALVVSISLVALTGSHEPVFAGLTMLETLMVFIGPSAAMAYRYFLKAKSRSEKNDTRISQELIPFKKIRKAHLCRSLFH